MEDTMKTRTQTVLVVLQVLTWIVFVGMMVLSGAILFSYVISLFNPDAARNFYMGLNLSKLQQADTFQYSLAAFFMAAIPGLKAYIAYVVILTLSRVNLQNPFTMDVVRKLETISYDLVAIYAIAILQHAHTVWLGIDIGTDWGGGETLFMAGLVFVISQVFKRGVEIQAENELTV